MQIVKSFFGMVKKEKKKWERGQLPKEMYIRIIISCSIYYNTFLFENWFKNNTSITAVSWGKDTLISKHERAHSLDFPSL